MFLGLYALEPGFTDYQNPLHRFWVPGDFFNDTACKILVDMLRKQSVEVRLEHNFSSEAVFDGEKEPDMHLLIFPPPCPLELCCNLFWQSERLRTFLWYAFSNEPIKIPRLVLKTWLQAGEMAFIIGPLLQPSTESVLLRF